jgi:HK97 family phage prohead protease
MPVLIDSTNRREVRDLAPGLKVLGFADEVTVIRGIDAKTRTVTALVSTPAVDRYGEVVEPSAYKDGLAQFMANPVLVANHQYAVEGGASGVIGKWTAMAVTKDGLEGTAKFLPAGDALADNWWTRVEAGVVNSFSVGFIPKAIEHRDYTREDGTHAKRRHYTSVDLLEVSVVSIPANPEARLRALLSAAAPAPGNAGVAGMADGDLASKQLAAIEAAVSQTLAKLLNTDPGSELHRLVADVVEAAQAGGGHTCGSGDDDRNSPPGTVSAGGDQAAIERATQALQDLLKVLRS